MKETTVINLQDWQFLPFSAVPIGKRVKNTVINPEDNSVYYFKEPELKYPWEHWTEIAASKIGAHLDFNVLDYNIGIYGDRVGCISKSMTEPEDELIHGQQFLTQIKPKFDKKKGSDHSFQLINVVFQDPNLYAQFGEFLKMIVFDAIIGNRDRHQQNWGVIRTVRVAMKKGKIDAHTFRKERNFWNFILNILKGQTGLDSLIKNIDIKEEYSFTPFFDNGNCLGYNLTNEAINIYLQNEEKLKTYLFGKKATSHIKWENENLTHIELLRKVSEIYPNGINGIIGECLTKYKKSDLETIIYSLDNNFDNKRHGIYALTLQRKELMCKLIKLRIDSLQQLLV